MSPLELGAISAVMGILCGIIAIVGGTIATIKKQANEREIRERIIAEKLDPETAKLLITPDKGAKKDPYSALKWGCVLSGLLVGYLVSLAFQVSEGVIGFWIILAAGVGLGLLVSFFVMSHLEKKHPAGQSEIRE